MTFWLPASRRRFCKSFDTLDLRSVKKSRSLIRSLSPGKHQPYTKRDAGQCSRLFSPALGLFSVTCHNLMWLLKLHQQFLWVTADSINCQHSMSCRPNISRSWKSCASGFFFFKLPKVVMFRALGLRWPEGRTSVSVFLSFHAVKIGVTFDRFEGLMPHFAGVEHPMDYHSITHMSAFSPKS